MSRWAELERLVRERVTGERLAHVYRVIDTARELATRFGAPVAQAEEAALMHDYCRQMPGREQLAAARQRNLIIDPVEEAQPQLLHGPLAATLLAEAGVVTDEVVLGAIRWHTTGRANMTLLDKVIWVADYTEPGRQFPGVEPVREAARHDLDRALLLALDQTIAFVLQRGWMLHPYTVYARNWLLSQAVRD